MWWVTLLSFVWLAVLGASVGSFLNVVVYRLPRGMSLARPRSHCPACSAPIRARDNVPIFGWLLLGGRCRDCGAAISPRYPAVEAATMLIFLVLAIEPFSGGANLPIGPPGSGRGALEMQAGMLWGIYAFHVYLCCVLLVQALVVIDGQQLSGPSAIFTLAVAVVAPAIWPQLRPFASTPYIIDSWAAGLADAIAVVVPAILLTWLAPRYTPESAAQRFERVAALVWIGLVLGTWALLPLSVVAAAVWCVLAAMARRGRPELRRLGYSAILLPLAVLWIVFWRPIDDWLSLHVVVRENSWLLWLPAMVVLRLLTWAARLGTERDHQSTP